jgi:PII-like signaling protein
MKPGDKAKRLRIYISSTDKFEHKPLYEAIVYSAREQGVAGATVLRGIMGFGSSSGEVYTNKLWEISEKEPLVVELIDESDKIDLFLKNNKDFFASIAKGHIITLDDTTIIMHKAGKKK